jgi:hypothetical protein
VKRIQGSDDAETRDASQVICEVYHKGWLPSLYELVERDVWEREVDRDRESDRERGR